MSATRSDRRALVRSQRPKATTVFAAAFLAGAAAAVGLNRTLDVHLAQRQPRVESEPIFVALRSLPQGAPLTVWDVALRDWPKAMLPAAALRARDSFAGTVLKYPLREGQPILSVQLVKSPSTGDGQVAEAAAVPTPVTGEDPAHQADLWTPAEVPPATPSTESVSQTAPAAPEAVAAESVADATAVPALAPPVEAAATEPAGADQVVAAPVITEPLIVAVPTATDVDSVTAPEVAPSATESGAASEREMVMRYLVVPERIALEADRSFVPTAEKKPAEAAVVATDMQAVPKRPAPPTAQARTQAGPAPRAATRTSTSRDRQPQRPPRSAAVRPAPARQPEKTSLLRSLMPSLSLGMGAVEPAARTAVAPESAAEPKSDQPMRPAFRGFGLFR